MSYQGAAYEGLTCNFLEIAFAAGGRVAVRGRDAGGARLAREPGGAEVHGRRDRVRRGAARRGHLHGGAGPARVRERHVSFMRNWSYAYALNQKAPKVQGQLRGLPAAAVGGREARGDPGRQRPVPLRLLGEPGGRAAVRRPPDVAGDAEAEHGRVLAPVGARGDVRGRRRCRRRSRTRPSCEQAIEQAKPRPVSPVYTQISQAIYKNVNAALARRDQPGGRARAGERRDQRGARDVLMVSLLIVGAGARGATFADWARRHPVRRARRRRGRAARRLPRPARRRARRPARAALRRLARGGGAPASGSPTPR